jgi:hypothetical protein
MGKSIFKLILIVFSFWPLLADNTIRIENTSVILPDSGKFYIVMENDVEVNGVNFIIQFDPTLITPLNIQPVERADSLSSSAAYRYSDNQISFIIYDNDANFIPADSGRIFAVEFLVNDTLLLADTTTQVEFFQGIAADPTITEIPFNYFNGAVTIYPPVVPPAVPALASPPDGATDQPTDLVLQWFPAGSIGTVYHLQVARDANFDTLSFNDSTIVDTAQQVGALENNTTYYWRVKAKNIAGVSDFSGAWHFSTTIYPLNAPALASPANGAINQPTTLILNWHPMDGPAPTLVLQPVHEEKSKDDEHKIHITSAKTDAPKKDSPRKKVQEKNPASESTGIGEFKKQPTREISEKNKSQPSLPMRTRQDVSLFETESLLLLTYNLQVATDMNFTNIVFNDSMIVDTFHQAGPLEYNKQHYWRVQATNISGTGPFSPGWGFTTIFGRAVYAGWNIVGLPSDVADKFYLSIFPNAIPQTLFAWQGSYVAEDTLELGKGYWLRFSAPEAIPIGGNPVFTLPLNLMEGWNLISGVSCEIPLANVSDPLGIIVPGTLYGFEGSYVSSDTVHQGYGYWLRTSGAGQVTLSCAPVPGKPLAKKSSRVIDLSEYASMEITDASGAGQVLYFDVTLKDPLQKLSYSLPPLPPAGLFDARFEGGYRIAEDVEEAMIQLQTSFYPLTIKISNLPEEGGREYSLQEMVGDEVFAIHNLQQGSEITIENPRVHKLNLIKSEIEIPTEFILQQNYPNPFNPVTHIRYGLPKPSHVTVTLYNTLGQRVKVLVDERKEAGYHIFDFEPHNLASGIYFYRMEAGKFKQVKKMLFLK